MRRRGAESYAGRSRRPPRPRRPPSDSTAAKSSSWMARSRRPRSSWPATTSWTAATTTRRWNGPRRSRLLAVAARAASRSGRFGPSGCDGKRRARRGPETIFGGAGRIPRRRRIRFPAGARAHPRRPDRDVRLLRHGRRGAAGSVRRGARRLARQGGPEESRRVDHDRRAAKAHRPDTPRADPNREGGRCRPARASRTGGGGRRFLADDVSRRSPAPDLHLLPSDAFRGSPNRADVAHARRSRDGRDRACLSPAGAHARSTVGAGEAQDRRGEDPLRGSESGGAAGTAGLRSDGHLPHLQRGLHGGGGLGPASDGSLRRSDPAGSDAASLFSGGTGDSRAPGFDAPPRFAKTGAG